VFAGSAVPVGKNATGLAQKTPPIHGVCALAVHRTASSEPQASTQ
jgi:hypothetical protein